VEGQTGQPIDLAGKVEPVTFLTVGTRQNPPGRPPGMSVFNVFFDKPATRPYRTYVSERETKQARVTSRGRRATVAMDRLSIGPFSGEFQLSFYAGCDLVHMEAVVATEENDRAILYDAGLAADRPGWKGFAWLDAEGRWQRRAADSVSNDDAVAVRHRALI